MLTSMVRNVSLAFFEMRSLLARVLWHFDLALCEESSEWPRHKAYLLWDRPSLWVEISRRAG